MSGLLKGIPPLAAGAAILSLAAVADPLPPDATYRPLPTQPLDVVKAIDEADKPQVMQRQRRLLEQRYDLSDRPMPGAMMSGGRKPVQDGGRVRLPANTSWDDLAGMTPGEIARKACCRPASCRCRTSSSRPAGKCSRMRRSSRSGARRSQPAALRCRHGPAGASQAGVSGTDFPHQSSGARRHLSGQLLTIRNFYELTVGLITPVQMEGLRLLLSPFPQEEFNQTEDRKVPEQSLGVACLDCHSNFHTNGAFHLTPDVRPQAARFRLDTTSLRGMFNQQIHGSKRSLRSVEDFTEFEQRTAYFNGDHVSATRKGVSARPAEPGRDDGADAEHDRLPAGAEARSAGTSISDPGDRAGAGGRAGVPGQGQCGVCHIPQTAFMDNNMHDLKLERSYEIDRRSTAWSRCRKARSRPLHCAASRTRRRTFHDGRP